MRDVARLKMEQIHQSLIPKDLTSCLLDDELSGILMQYFYGANQVIEKMAGGYSKLFARKAFYDTLGGYLQYYMVPISRYSYYAGLVKIRTVENILQLYSQCKEPLNTNGNSWRAPISDFTDLDIHIEPLRIIIHNQEEDTSCIQLDLLDERTTEDDNMIVALPRLDPQEGGLLGNIWLPFKRKRTFNLQSDMSAFILLRYFDLATRCYSYQGIRQHTFNKKFKEWIWENLEVHFNDDVLYAGLGGILRIVETLRRKNSTTIVMTKTNEKRHKTTNYKMLEHKAKQLEKHSGDWLQSVFATKSEDDNLKETFNVSLRRRYMYIAFAVAVLLFIFVIAWAFLLKQRRKRSHRPSSSADDEEVLLGPESSSIASSNKSTKRVKSLKSNRDSASSSSSPPQAPKCFALCTKKNHDYRQLVSSMDSESEGEIKTSAESPGEQPKTTQLGTVYEKKRVTISRKAKKKDEDHPGSSPKVVILKK